MSSIREVAKRYHSVALKNKALGRGWIKNNADISEMNRISMVNMDVLISRYDGYNGVMNPERGFGCVCSVFAYAIGARTYGDKFIDAEVIYETNMGREVIRIETENLVFRISYNGNPDAGFQTIEIIRKERHTVGGNVYAPRRFV